MFYKTFAVIFFQYFGEGKTFLGEEKVFFAVRSLLIWCYIAVLSYFQATLKSAKLIKAKGGGGGGGTATNNISFSIYSILKLHGF